MKSESTRVRADNSNRVQRNPVLSGLRNVPIEWKQTYRTALQEKDLQRLGAAVRLAESAIQTRLQELESVMGGAKSVERAELKTAIRDLQAIKVEYRLP